jgi:hypothetical protein
VRGWIFDLTSLQRLGEREIWVAQCTGHCSTELLSQDTVHINSGQVRRAALNSSTGSISRSPNSASISAALRANRNVKNPLNTDT